MRTAPPARETLAAGMPLVASGAAVDLRLRAGDEGRQAIDCGIIRLRLLLRRILRLRTMMLALASVFALAAVLAGLLLVTLMIASAIVAHIGLRLVLRRHEAGLLAKARIIFPVVLAVLADHVLGAWLLLGLVLAELLLRRGDQAEIMFG